MRREENVCGMEHLHTTILFLLLWFAPRENSIKHYISFVTFLIMKQKKIFFKEMKKGKPY